MDKNGRNSIDFSAHREHSPKRFFQNTRSDSCRAELSPNKDKESPGFLSTILVQQQTTLALESQKRSMAGTTSCSEHRILAIDATAFTLKGEPTGRRIEAARYRTQDYMVLFK